MAAAASAQNVPVADMDLQAVEGISRDTLVALLKRKDKEAKALASKVDKMEEKAVKEARIKKILLEDRSSFLRFCGELLPECSGMFEEAAAQETPVNLEALLQRLTTWRRALEVASDDRSVLRRFVELVFPGDEVALELFEGQSLGLDAFDALQQRWVALEDLHNQSIASINALAQEQMQVKSREIEELREHVNRLARERAQSMTHRGEASMTPVAATSPSSALATAGGSNSSCSMPSATSQDAAAAELGEARRQAEHHARDARDAREATEAAEQRERAVGEMLEVRNSELQMLQQEVDQLREDSDRLRSEVKRLSEQSDEASDQMRQKIHELEQEVGSNAFIARLAEQQAARDTEMKAHHRQVQELTQTLRQNQQQLALSYDQEGVLKGRIRELESSCDRGHVAGDYLKHVVLKYIHYNQRGDMKAQTLVPVLCTLLHLNPEERSAVEKPAVPTPLLFMNQAIGEATSWFRGDTEKVPGLSSTVGAMSPAPFRERPQ